MGIAPLPREAPYRAGGAQQGDLSSRKTDLLNTGTIGHVPGHDYTLRGSSLRAGGVEEAWANKQAPIAPGGPRPGNGPRRPMPRDVEVYRIDAPGGGSFVRHLDGHTTHERDRPGLVEYMNSLDPDDPEEADEHAHMRNHIQAEDDYRGHKLW